MTRSRPGPIETRAEDWQTHTAYDFLQFEDFIQRDLAAADLAHRIPLGVDLLAAGLQRHHRAVHQSATGGSTNFPPPIRISCCCWRPSAPPAVAFVFQKGLDAIGVPAPDRHSGRGLPDLRGAGWHRAEIHRKPAPMCSILLSDRIWTWEFAHRPAARLGCPHRSLRGAPRRSVARRGDAEEIVIVGHSSGSFLGTELLARALQARSRSRPARPARGAADGRRQSAGDRI